MIKIIKVFLVPVHIWISTASLIKEDSFQIVIDQVSLFESNKIIDSPAMSGITVLSVASLGMTGFCIANPKACFGSCPTFYASDGQNMVLQAEGFSASIAPALEAVDTDALYKLKTDGKTLNIKVTNEALETHVIRYADLIAVPKKNKGRVFATGEGTFYQSNGLYKPVLCRGPEGDFQDQVEFYDGEQRFSTSDSFNLASKEILELEFKNVDFEKAGLVIAFKQTLLTTYLFYQALSYMGNSTAYWLARLERDQNSFDKMRGLWQNLGSIEVFHEKSNNQWEKIGVFNETGPIADNIELLPFEILKNDNIRIKLVMSKGMWRIDYLALTAIGEPLTKMRIKPHKVSKADSIDKKALHNLQDSLKSLVTLPGEVYTLYYNLPGNNEEYEFFVQSKGYYLEWMRDEWLKEENFDLTLTMFNDSKNFLKFIAPKFKAVEATMEETFWRSKYAPQ